MAIKTFHVGVKAVIHTENGVLLIKHAGGWWDMPGGRIDDDESLEQALDREISEEIEGASLKTIHKQLLADRPKRETENDVGLVLVYFDVEVNLPPDFKLSEEHTEYRWIQKGDTLPEPLNPVMARIVLETLEK